MPEAGVWENFWHHRKLGIAFSMCSQRARSLAPQLPFSRAPQLPEHKYAFSTHPVDRRPYNPTNAHSTYRDVHSHPLSLQHLAGSISG